MLRIYIIRHAQTNANIRFECVGRKDIPLNEAGHIQSKELAERLSDVTADKIYISPLIRTKETIDYYLTEHKGIPVQTAPELIERDFGDWEGLTFDEIEAQNKEAFDQWQSDQINFVIPGGECSARVQERINSFFDRITKENENKTIFVVTHLGTARHSISRLLRLKPEESWRFTMFNASYAVIDYDNTTDCGVLKYLNS
jgi:broad specificity phosphatase PhoE